MNSLYQRKLSDSFINPRALRRPGGTLERTGDEFNTVLMTEPGSIDPLETDIYCPAVVQYPWADDTYYLSFMPLYRHYPFGDTSDTILEEHCSANKNGQVPNDGPVDIRLAASADGIVWTRPDYKAYMALGVEPGWDAGSLYMTPNLIRRGNEIWQYFTVSSVTHGLPNEFSLGIAKQRLDGFVSADAAYSGGAFTTPLLRFNGKKLILNINCSALGCARVEIRNQYGRPLPGFLLEDCIEIDRNHLTAEVQWRTGKIEDLAGQPIRMHFQLRDCQLYAFQFCD